MDTLGQKSITRQDTNQEVLKFPITTLRSLEVDNRRLKNLNLRFLFKISELFSIQFLNLKVVQDKNDYQALMQKIERKRG